MSEVNQTASPPVFKDRIAPTQAPASIGSATAEQAMKKQEAVVQNYEKRASELSPLVGTQQSPQEVETKVISAEQAVEAASSKTEQANTTENVVPESGLYGVGVLRRLMGKRTAAEQANDVAEANAALARAEESRTQAEADLKASQMYSNEYIAKQSDPKRVQELIEANKRGGPMAVSIEMVDALNRQDLLQEQVRFYESKRIDIPQDKMLPLDVYMNMKARIGKDYHHQRGDVESLILMMTAANESALNFADSNGLRVEQERLVDAYDLGLGITDGVTGGDTSMVYDFVKRKLGRDYVTADETGYYAVAAAQLDRLFTRNQIPEGEGRVPYIIAYTAGALANGAAMYLGNISRDLIADTIPYAKTEMVRKNGNWVEETQPSKPRGLGSFVTQYHPISSWAIQRNGTSDKGLAEVMKKAGDIVRDMDQKFKGRGVSYPMIRHFNVQDVLDPLVINPR